LMGNPSEDSDGENENNGEEIKALKICLFLVTVLRADV
jgi:hypothetical protein